MSVTMVRRGMGVAGGTSSRNLGIPQEYTDAGTDFTGVYGCDLCAEAEADGAQALPFCVDVGAAVSLQPGVRGLRQDSVSGAYFEAGIVAGSVLQGRGRVRDADGLDSWRRAADALADRQDCGRLGGAQEIHLFVHECAAVERKAGPLQAEQVPDIFRTHGRAKRTPRFFGVPRRRLRTGH